MRKLLAILWRDQLITGHLPTLAHQHAKGLAADPSCPTCLATDNLLHLLTECKKYTLQRKVFLKQLDLPICKRSDLLSLFVTNDVKKLVALESFLLNTVYAAKFQSRTRKAPSNRSSSLQLQRLDSLQYLPLEPCKNESHAKKPRKWMQIACNAMLSSVCFVYFALKFASLV